MKAVFVNFNNLELPLRNSPTTRFAANDEGINTCTRVYMSLTGNIPVDDDTALTGEIMWCSDDDMLMDSYTVENFLRYEVNNVEGSEDGTTEATSTLLLTNDPVPDPVTPVEPTEPTEEELLAAAKEGRADAIATARDATIAAGIDVETEYGTEHFTLEEKDKTLLLSIYAMVQAGVTSYPYHSINASDSTSNICAIYSDTDITNIVTAAFTYVTYHESYANMLLQWLERETDYTVVYTIEYGVALPEDLDAYLDMVLVAAGIDPTLFDGSSSEDTSTDSSSTESTDSSTEESTDTSGETTDDSSAESTDSSATDSTDTATESTEDASTEATDSTTEETI